MKFRKQNISICVVRKEMEILNEFIFEMKRPFCSLTGSEDGAFSAASTRVVWILLFVLQ
jgi:hypothetical protein